MEELKWHELKYFVQILHPGIAMIWDLTIRLRARDFYEVIEGEARINYHLIEIESE